MMHWTQLVRLATRSILCCILSGTCVCGVLMFGDPSANSVFGSITRGVDALLNTLWKWAKMLLGERVIAGITRAFNYVVRERNPILQSVYILVVCGSFTLFITYIWPYWRLFERDAADKHKAYYALSSQHIPFSTMVMLGCLISWFLCCWADPGEITSENHFVYWSMFKFGPIFAWADAECKTCQFKKPARSKHCSLCKCCVAKFDHHCPWINSCVGIGNYHYFINFLFIHWFMCLYGTYQMLNIIYYIAVIDQDLFSKKFINRVTKKEFTASYRLVFQWMMSHHQVVVSLSLVGAIMGIVLFAFWAYHFFCLALRNSTTNENHKYGQLRSFMRWRERQKAKEAQLKAEGKEIEEKEQGRRFLFKDFDMAQWSKVNIYDEGFVQNLYSVYFPYRGVHEKIANAKKREAQRQGDGDGGVKGNTEKAKASDKKTQHNKGHSKLTKRRRTKSKK